MNLNPFSSNFYVNPADKAMPYLNQIPQTITPYYTPTIEAGNQSLSEIMRQYSQLVSNPSQKFNDLSQDYQQSPGYQFQYNQGMNAANAAAAAGGYLGNNAHQMSAASMSSNLANQDFYNYLSKIMDMYGSGLSGYQGVNQMGYGASNELANSLGNNLLNQSNMAYSGAKEQNKANGDLFNSLLSLGTGLFTAYNNRDK